MHSITAKQLCISFVVLGGFLSLHTADKKLDHFTLLNFRYNKPEKITNISYPLYQDLFYTNHIENVPEDAPYIIPKIIHIIWLGSPPPDFVLNCYESFKAYHPTWNVLLWTDENFVEFNIKNKLLFSLTNNFGQKADILRYELLQEFGGVYVDSDMLCLKPFDDLNQKYEFYTGLLSHNRLGIGLIASVPNHPILNELITSMPKEVSEKSLKIIHGKNKQKMVEFILETTGNYFFHRCFDSVAPLVRDGIIVLPCTYFYPSPATSRFNSLSHQMQDIKPESYCIHIWNTTWLNKQIPSLVHKLYKLKVLLEKIAKIISIKRSPSQRENITEIDRLLKALKTINTEDHSQEKYTSYLQA